MLDFETTVRSRQSIRAFLPTPIKFEDINQVLLDAQSAPSSCNTQPWNVHIVSGDMLKKLTKVMLEKLELGEYSPDVDFKQEDYKGIYEERWRSQYKFVFDSFDVARTDVEGRKKLTARNFEFYGAPHAAFLFVPKIPNHEIPVAADMAMYAQNFLLSLTARGFGGIPQFVLGLFAGEIKKILNISDDYIMLYGLSFGHPDWDAKPNKDHLKRVAVEEIVTFHN
nr:nitroreductase [Acinetobacter sp. Marseille-Q1620]